MKPSNFPLGMIIAERMISLFDPLGQKRTITVRLGAPVKVPFSDPTATLPQKEEDGDFVYRCPVQIEGLDHDERVFPIMGEDPFVALQYAIDFVGDLLRDGSERLALANRNRVDSHTRKHWIWQYPDK